MSEQIQKQTEDDFDLNLDFGGNLKPDDVPQEKVVEISLRSIILFFIKESGVFGLTVGNPFDRWKISLMRNFGLLIDPGAILQEIEALKRDGYVVSKFRQVGTCSKAEFFCLAPGVKLEIK